MEFKIKNVQARWKKRSHGSQSPWHSTEDIIKVYKSHSEISHEFNSPEVAVQMLLTK